MKTHFLLIFLSLLTLTLHACGKEDANGHFEAAGSIEATTITLSSKVNGEIAAISVREGLTAQAGDTLLRVDDAELQIIRRQAAAQVAFTDAQLRLAINGARREDKKQAAKNVDAAKAALEQAKADFERIRPLFESKSVSQKQYDDAKNMLDMRQAQRDAAQQVLEKLLNGARVEEIDVARAAKAQAEAALALTEKRLADCVILAPSAGTITELLVEVGEHVTPGRDVLTLADLRTVKLKVYVPEKQMTSISYGQSVKVAIDGATQTFQGKVSYISDVAEFTPKTIQTKDERVKLVFAVEIELPNPDSKLKPGLPADAYFGQ